MALRAAALSCFALFTITATAFDTINVSDALDPNGKAPSRPCAGNTPHDRSTWCDFDIDTDYYTEGPSTGQVKEYFFELRNTTVAPDGVPRVGLTVNGGIPGPTIEANWGDTVVVHITNSFQNNGTSIHFHGVRQLGTNSEDGVNSITQCPTPPGSSITYTWKATQYGSSWYHSHFGLQAWEGVYGGIIIHGPATANYDKDLGSLFAADWSHETADALYISAQMQGPPTLDTGLINGKNVYNGTGERWSTRVQTGKSYRLRIINPSIDSFMAVSIDNHPLTVIANDFVPIVPYTTNLVGLGPGQRYDVIFTANQQRVARDFWLRVVPDSTCSENANPNNIKGIIHYGSSNGTPNTTAWTTNNAFFQCQDPPLSQLKPRLSIDASGTADVTSEQLLTITTAPGTNVFKWYLNNITFLSEWNDPTAVQILNGNSSWEPQEAVIELPRANEWMYLIMESTNPAAHPIHLHGHDFWVLASGNGSFSTTNSTLKLRDSPRRDVVMLPASGYVVIAFPADNPGAWLCHCHIGWHTEMGFALQFVERESEVPALYDENALSRNCRAWDAYDNASGVVQDDSGV